MKPKKQPAKDTIYLIRNTKYGSYFDYAAATPISPSVKKAMESYLSDAFFNPKKDDHDIVFPHV